MARHHRCSAAGSKLFRLTLRPRSSSCWSQLGRWDFKSCSTTQVASWREHFLSMPISEYVTEPLTTRAWAGCGAVRVSPQSLQRWKVDGPTELDVFGWPGGPATAPVSVTGRIWMRCPGSSPTCRCPCWGRQTSPRFARLLLNSQGSSGVSPVSESTAVAPLGRFDRSGAITMSGMPAPGIPRLSRSLAGS